MNLSIVTPLYETKEIFEKCLNSVIENTTCSFEFLVVYNHPPYKGMLKWLNDVSNRYGEVKVLDPGQNIGCHMGCNYGFQEAKGDFLVKLDADTALKRNNRWAQLMIDVFENDDKIGLLAPEIISCFSNEPLRQGGNYEEKQIGNYKVDIKKDGVLGFSCVMFPRSVWESFGPMMSKYFVNGQPITREFYGGEEVDYAEKARKKGYSMGIMKNVQAMHYGRSEGSDPVFGHWKFFYGHGKTSDDMETWAKNLRLTKEQFHAQSKAFNLPEAQTDQAWDAIEKAKT